MVDNNTAMILCSVFGLIALLGITVLIRHCNNKDYDEMRLNAPLIEMEKHDRHEAATRYDDQSVVHESSSNNALTLLCREADAGAQACHVCGFDNFKNTAFCALCGGALVSSKSAAKSGLDTSSIAPRALRAR